MLTGNGKIKDPEKFVRNVPWMQYVLDLHMNTGLISNFLAILKYLNFVTLTSSWVACIEGALNSVAAWIFRAWLKELFHLSAVLRNQHVNKIYRFVTMAILVVA
jgi:hypothetical protein